MEIPSCRRIDSGQPARLLKERRGCRNGRKNDEYCANFGDEKRAGRTHIVMSEGDYEAAGFSQH